MEKDVLASIIYNREKMEITLMPCTKGTSHKLRDTSMMECITQTLETNTLRSGKVFIKSLEGQKHRSVPK